MKKVLVTGTAGFIGFHLAKRLLEEGDVIIGIDCINDYYDPKIKEKRNEILLGYDNYKFNKIDFSVFEDINKVIKEEKPDVIIHLAAQAGVRYSIENPWAYEQANSLGTMNIFECVKRNKITRVLFASSSSVYGANKKVPFAEKDKTDKPVSLYAATKKGNELIAYSYRHLYGIEIAGLRFFTVYGSFGRPDMAYFKFAKKILLDKPIDIYNNGEMGRDFTYIDDIVDGVIAIMNKSELKFEIYNLGGDNPIRLMKFVELIEKNMGKEAQKNFLPMQPGDIKETYADISKARSKVGYQPKTKIEDGLKIFCDWFKENKGWLLKLEDAKQ